MQRRRSRPISHSVQTIRASPTNADPRARRQNPRCASAHGAHEHPAREQDGRRDPPCLIRRASNLFFPSHSSLTGSHKSFAKIAQADAAQLERLPGFGPKKVSRLKDAFERPFRTGTTSDALSAPAATTATTVLPAPATELPSTSRGGGGRTGDEGPRWDIGLDPNAPSPAPAPAKP